jgi:hypothetical protein
LETSFLKLDIRRGWPRIPILGETCWRKLRLVYPLIRSMNYVSFLAPKP